MAKTGVVQNKGLQLIVSRDEAVQLAHTGMIHIDVRDTMHKPFGVAAVMITPLVQAAILEHMDMHVPPVIAAEAEAEQKRLQTRSA